MQVSVESTGKLERRMQVQVPAERVSEEIAARLKKGADYSRVLGSRSLTRSRATSRSAGRPCSSMK